MMWQPVSGCGDQCRDGADRVASPIRQAARLVAAAVVLLSGFVLVPLFRGAGLRLVSRAMLAAFGVRVERRGPALRPGSLVVANHVSWLDIVVLLATSPASLVAKGEVGAWPGIGVLTKLSGAIFIDRSRPKALPGTVAEVAAALRAGRTVAAFPEGTTYCGTSHGRFRPALFQAAIDAGAPVVPASILYDTTAAAFIGDDTLWASLRRVSALRSLTVTLVTAPALRPVPDASRKILARAAQSSMRVSGYRLAA
ncbi:1-acyl-sn-glycerol-3-phosphate acyltransferase [Actinoplanes sp. TBRC 11911]|uniref:lysophospholipid acyltransferase family protein n=1 Tax=Actinoplanes sp. TBRC 11911 TaxID=2729386 RepID=UPI00145FA347|nr:lysophospholipid acyltransferase family protein [Actinoplanes sp. TBRC 11911]NMO50608.1 1-acyl-sn-glycerol-3-phosphate acyltransferase [Actinoplanes sp. TBRC 11911]